MVTFKYDGVAAADFGVYISGEATFTRPARDRQIITVPGRNGDLIIDNGRYENVTVTYPCFIRENFDYRFRGFMDWLGKHKTYARLEDGYHEDEYRLAVPEINIEPRTGPENFSGHFTVTFNCKPQRFLITNEDAIAVDPQGSGFAFSVTNPTSMEAKPYISVVGYGTLAIGSQTLVIAQHSQSYMIIDSELQDAYCGVVNLNSYLTGDFPALGAGTTTISGDSTITYFMIEPRWWRL